MAIYYNCPEFYNGYLIYCFFNELNKKNPEAFYEDTYISSIFGCFPNAIWNGGAICIYPQKETEYKVKQLISMYNNTFNIPLRFTFTNPILEKKHCYDNYCNMIARAGHNGMNEILVSSPILEEYLRKNYPNYKFVKSIISPDNTSYIGSEKYSMVVINRKYNNDFEYLNNIPQEYRDKVEFLCNEPCPDICTKQYEHYKEQGKIALANSYNVSNFKCDMLDIKGDFPHKFAKTQKSYISRDKIINDYLPLGFNQFKLSGRHNPGLLIPILIDNFIKPEYQYDVYSELLSTLFHEGVLKIGTF